MAWAKNGTPDDLSGTSTTMSISDLTAKKFNVFLAHYFKTASLLSNNRINADSGSLYATRISYSGAADGTTVSQTSLETATANSANDEFHISYLVGISGEEKLMIDFGVERNTAGAGTAPTRSEYVGKYVPSPLTDTIDEVSNIVNTSTLATDSNLTALGTD